MVDKRQLSKPLLQRKLTNMTEQNPSPTPGSQSGLMGRGEYLEVTYSEDRAPKSGYPDLLAEHVMQNVFRQPGRLLDIGCGRGDFLNAFSKVGFDVAGIDISPSAPDFSPDHTVKVVDLEREPLPFEKASFDFVFTKSVVEHLRSPVTFLERAFDALKPGGVIVAMTPSWIHNAWGPFYIDHTHVTPFTAPSLKDALTFAGFEQAKATHFYQLPFLWRLPVLTPVVAMFSKLPLPYRPMNEYGFSDGVNKFIRFSKEVMLFGVAIKPGPK